MSIKRSDSRLIEVPVYLGENGGRSDYNCNLVAIEDGWVTNINDTDNVKTLLWGLEDFNGWMAQGKRESTPKNFKVIIEGRSCKLYFKELYYSKSEKPCLRATFELFGEEENNLNIEESLINEFITFFVVGDLEVDSDSKNIDWFQINGFGINNKYSDTTDILFTKP